MLNMARMEAKNAESVTDIVKEITISDGILHTKVAWKAIDPQCITNCFRWSGVLDQDEMTSPSPSMTTIENDDRVFRNG